MADTLALRLAIAFTDPTRRPALEAHYAIDAEIDAASHPALEHTVAHAKLEWWRGEIERLVAGAPQHPLTRQLLARAGPGRGYGRLGARLTVAELLFVGYAPASVTELLTLLERWHGSVQSLAAELLSPADRPNAAAGDYGAHLGRGLGLVDALEPARAPWLGDLARPALAQQAERELLAAAAALPSNRRPEQVHGLVLARLARARLDHLTRDPTASGPGPLSQLWCAWRTARHAHRE